MIIIAKKSDCLHTIGMQQILMRIQLDKVEQDVYAMETSKYIAAIIANSIKAVCLWNELRVKVLKKIK